MYETKLYSRGFLTWGIGAKVLDFEAEVMIPQS